MKLKYVIVLIIHLCSIRFIAAQTCTLNIQPVFDTSPLTLVNASYLTSTGDTIWISSLKFYISGIELLHNDSILWKEENSFHLLDASNPKSLKLPLKIPFKQNFNKIKFNLGIDSTTNVSGAMGGDLDPTRGMYWTWQSGYINFKLEGKSNVCPTRNNQFEFHLGGYYYPYISCQTILLDIKSQENIVILMDLKKLIEAIDLSTCNQIMSPGKEALFLSQKISQIFNIQ